MFRVVDMKILLSVVIVGLVTSRNVLVDLKAPWSLYSTSPVVEISEFIYNSKSSQSFWTYVENICGRSEDIDDSITQNNSTTYYDIESIAINVASQQLSESSYLFLETLYGLGTYSPTSRFYDTLTQGFAPCGQGNSYVIHIESSTIICHNISDAIIVIHQSYITNDVNMVNNQVLGSIHDDIDKLYTPTSEQTDISTTMKIKPNLTLYGSIGTTSFCQLHQELKLLAESYEITYRMRHAFPGFNVLEHHTSIPGYGIFLDIKHMEYKNIDDSKPATATTTATTTASSTNGEDSSEENTDNVKNEIVFPVDEEVNGIYFHKLQQRNPTLSTELSIFRTELLEQAAGSVHEMKVWKMKELGLQVLQAMSNAKYPVHKYIDIVQNFPMYAPTLSSLKVSDKIKHDLMSFYNSGISSGEAMNSVCINGNLYDLSSNSFNIYNLLTSVYQDIQKLSDLELLSDNVTIRSIIRQTALSLGSGDSSSSSSSSSSEDSEVSADEEDEDDEDEVDREGSKVIDPFVGLPSEFKKIIRIDVSIGAKNVITFVNNLEKDSMYKRWPKQLQQLTYPSWSLHTISRNLYTVIGVIDPLTVNGLSLIQQINEFYQQSYPIRFGLVLSCPKSGTNGQTYEICSFIIRLFIAIRDMYKPSTATQFLFQLSGYLTRLNLPEVSTPNSLNLPPNSKKLPLTLDKVKEYSISSLSIVVKTDIKSTEIKTLISSIAKNITMYADNMRMMTQYIDARGLQLNSYSLNGITDNDGDLSSIMQYLGREQFLLSHWVRSGLIKEKTQSIFTTILKLSNAYSRYHPMLESPYGTYINIVNNKQFSIYLHTAHPITTTTTATVTTTTAATVTTTTTVTTETSLIQNTTIILFPLFKSVTTTDHPQLSLNYQAIASISNSLKWLYEMTPIQKHRVYIQLIFSPIIISQLLSINKIIPSSQSYQLISCDIYNPRNTKNTSKLSYESIEIMITVLHILDYIHKYSESIPGAIQLLNYLSETQSVLASIDMYLLQSASSTQQGTCTPTTTESESSLNIADNDSINGENQCLNNNDSTHNLIVTLQNVLKDGESMKQLFISHLQTYQLLEKVFKIDASVSDITVYYNTRKITIPCSDESTPPLNPYDLDLLATLEWKRIGSKLVSISHTQMTSDKYLEIMSFIGSYSSPSTDSSSSARSFSQKMNVEQLLLKSKFLKYPAVDMSTRGRGGEVNSHSNENQESSIVFRIPPTKVNPVAKDISVIYVVDPLSVAGQRASGLIKLFQQSLGISQVLIITPNPSISEFPLQNFYRPLFHPRHLYTHGSTSSGSGSEITSTTTTQDSEATIAFLSLPKQHTLTVRLDAPEAWNIQAHRAIQDIDNLRCDSTSTHCGDPTSTGSVSDTTQITYLLKSLLIAGQCFEFNESPYDKKPVNGLQLVLSSSYPITSYVTMLPLSVNTTDHDHNIDSENQRNNSTLSYSSIQVSGLKSTYHSDTLVMQNLGYYQLQANPGLWTLTLARGRATQLFTIDHSDILPPNTTSTTSSSMTTSGSKLILVKSYVDTIIRLGVTKRPGMEKVSLLSTTESDEKEENPGMFHPLFMNNNQNAFNEDEDDFVDFDTDESINDDNKYDENTDNSNENDIKTTIVDHKLSPSEESTGGTIWNSITSMFSTTSSSSPSSSSTSKPSKTAKKMTSSSSSSSSSSRKEDNRIHVFSLATGHMYERLLRIMMLSVTKRTSAPVKFWLFENYLSPSFKEMAEIMSKKYNFEVGYVTYKWPEWLIQQTQKQRIIWGYKILFLDVLFPLNVKKVIYVDADQVLRADLKELWNLNLHGKPYAYTPFCTSRQETLGFQFWREGYWKDHLRGKPYHISALYVVDLQRFRRYAVGDQLRSIYNGLARDPNSLSNLDQDLPNFAQHSVPIYSLPQEWLWCETWCSDDSKVKAKTIDLCNNPMYKEPKLDMARRVISGSLFNESWIELDNEIKELQLQHELQSSTTTAE